MRYRLLAAVFAVCLAARAQQTLSVEQLAAFIQSSGQFIKEKKMTDSEVARFLSKVKLTERLDDRTIEEMQSYGIGPKTLEALHALRDKSQALAAAKPIEPPARPAPKPPPSAGEQAAIIAGVREYALNYSKTLPDFICTQVTRRKIAAAPGTRYGGGFGSEPSYQTVDTLTIRLSYFEQKEDYKLIMVNNTPTSQDYRTLGGATSTGEFGSMLRDIFEPSTGTHFDWDHWATLRQRPAMAFAYRVAQSRSQWHLDYEHRLDLVPAYHGLIYVDTSTHAVVRVTLVAENIPDTFPIRQAETILDYYSQEIAGRPFLLPMKARTNMSADGMLTQNDVEFRMYRKYSAEAEIKYDITPDPLPEEKTKETKDPTPPPPAVKKKK
jgi:hypothetical protein